MLPKAPRQKCMQVQHKLRMQLRMQLRMHRSHASKPRCSTKCLGQISPHTKKIVPVATAMGNREPFIRLEHIPEGSAWTFRCRSRRRRWSWRAAPPGRGWPSGTCTPAAAAAAAPSSRTQTRMRRRSWCLWAGRGRRPPRPRRSPPSASPTPASRTSTWHAPPLLVVAGGEDRVSVLWWMGER